MEEIFPGVGDGDLKKITAGICTDLKDHVDERLEATLNRWKCHYSQSCMVGISWSDAHLKEAVWWAYSFGGDAQHLKEDRERKNPMLSHRIRIAIARNRFNDVKAQPAWLAPS